jgi:hypothetical protein
LQVVASANSSQQVVAVLILLLCLFQQHALAQVAGDLQLML